MLDLRLAFRNLLARPSFSVVALLTLTLGIGANTAVFTVFNAVLLSPLPYAQPQQIVVLNETSPQLPNASVTRYNYDDWRTRAQSFSAMGAFRPTSMTITGSGEPERVPAKMISANLLPLLGVAITQGRGFSDTDDKPGAEGVAIGFEPSWRLAGVGLALSLIVGVLAGCIPAWQAARAHIVTALRAA